MFAPCLLCKAEFYLSGGHETLSFLDWGMVQLVKHLPCKHKGLSLLPRIHVQKPGMMAHTYDSNAEVVDTGGSLCLMAH